MVSSISIFCRFADYDWVRGFVSFLQQKFIRGKCVAEKATSSRTYRLCFTQQIDEIQVTIYRIITLQSQSLKVLRFYAKIKLTLKLKFAGINPSIRPPALTSIFRSLCLKTALFIVYIIYYHFKIIYEIIVKMQIYYFDVNRIGWCVLTFVSFPNILINKRYFY